MTALSNGQWKFYADLSVSECIRFCGDHDHVMFSDVRLNSFTFICYSDQSEALKILTHPQSQGAVNGDKVTFAVVAEGSEHLTYEWLKDGVPISDPSAKAKSSIFTIPSFLPAEHKGRYQCIVSSDYDGSVDLAMSKPAELKGNSW